MGLQLRDELANSTREAIEALVDLWAVVKHYGPGPHPGTGTSQDVHGLLSSEVAKIELEMGVQRIPTPENRQPIKMKLWRGESKRTPVDEGMYGKGTYFTPHRHYAEGYALEGKLVEAEVFLKTPFVGEYNEVKELGRAAKQSVFEAGGTLPEANRASSIAIRKTLEEQGYDGIIIVTTSNSVRPDTVNEVIVFWEEGYTTRHYGPGQHPGTGTSQDIHGGESPGVFSWQDENIEHIPKKMGKNVPEGMDYRPGRWLGLHSEGMGDVFREFAKGHDYGGRVSWSYIEEKLGRLEDDMARERDNEFIFEGELSSEDDARRREMHGLWENFPGELSPPLEAAKHLNLRLLERDKTGVILAIRDVRSFKDWEPTLRHYGPGPHPGTGTSQDVHGGDGGPRAGKVTMTPTSRKQSGLGDFRIDRPAPSENNSIVFDDEELRVKGYSEEVIEQQREWFFANVSAAIIKMEDEMDIEIRGMEVTNSIIDLAERQAGPLVMGHPIRREAFMGRLREDTDEWLGGYYKGIVWLDDNHQGELLSGPKDYDFRETVHHEVGHFLTASDGRAKFSAEYVISMDDRTYTPSKTYLDTMKKFYGYDERVVADEYRADLVASYPIYTESWIRIIPGSMNEHDKRNQKEIVANLIDEAEFVTGLLSRTEEAEEEEDVLVFFKLAGEIRGVPRSALRDLPKDAVILSEIFKN